MEWFAFLIYFLIALFSSVVLWFTIKVGFRNAIPYELESAEPSAKKADALIAANSKAGLFWNFSSVLIIIPALILLLGISVRHLPLHNPMTYTLGGCAAFDLVHRTLVGNAVISETNENIRACNARRSF